jgi:hypothetical protein
MSCWPLVENLDPLDAGKFVFRGPCRGDAVRRATVVSKSRSGARERQQTLFIDHYAGALMARNSKRNRRIPKKKGSKRAKKRDSQTNQPFEQDSKRRIGQYGGTGEPPIMK